MQLSWISLLADHDLILVDNPHQPHHIFVHAYSPLYINDYYIQRRHYHTSHLILLNCGISSLKMLYVQQGASHFLRLQGIKVHSSFPQYLDAFTLSLQIIAGALGQYEQQFGIYCPNSHQSKSVIYIAVKAQKLLCDI